MLCVPVDGVIASAPPVNVWTAVGSQTDGSVLKFVRMVPVAISFVGTRASPQTQLFVGWFGPRGLASIVFTVIVLDESHLPHVDSMTAVVVLTILISVYAHGVTARPLTERYATWYAAHRERRPSAMETVEAGHQRWRRPTAIPVVSDRRG